MLTEVFVVEYVAPVVVDLVFLQERDVLVLEGGVALSGCLALACVGMLIGRIMTGATRARVLFRDLTIVS